MTIENLDYKCYKDAVDSHRDFQEDWLKSGYAPRGFYLKDFCLFHKDDTFHLFHIAGTPGVTCCLPGNELWFGHAATKDFIKWQTFEPCFYIDPSGWDNGHVFAPYVLEKDGWYWMFYTGVSIDNTQRIGAAVSEDLFSWERVKGNPLIRPEKYGWAFCPASGGAACRDPHIFLSGEKYNIYYTAVTKEGKSCIARAESTDLINWTDKGPAYISGQAAHCESSNVQEHNGKYLLFFGGHYEYWSYVISDNFKNWPDQDPLPLKKHVTAMEVIKKKKNRWLVSYFKFEKYRMFLGVIDWSVNNPSIQEISKPAGLKEFGF